MTYSEAAPVAATAQPGSDRFAEQRERMVRTQIEARGISDPRVLGALRRVPRHHFVPESQQAFAYEDRPLPIGSGQTISQPLIVGYMTEALRLHPQARVLEIGMGSGYQAAVLAELVAAVYTIEIVPELAQRAAQTLQHLGYTNIFHRVGDGFRGWPEEAPFDGIMLTASPPQVPQPLLDQLKVGGVLIAPVGNDWQTLIRITRTPTGFDRERLLDVRFVPMTGEAQAG